MLGEVVQPLDLGSVTLRQGGAGGQKMDWIPSVIPSYGLHAGEGRLYLWDLRSQGPHPEVGCGVRYGGRAQNIFYV